MEEAENPEKSKHKQINIYPLYTNHAKSSKNYVCLHNDADTWLQS